LGEIFFASLALKKRNPPKYQLEMAATVESLKATMESMAAQFKGFQEMMATSLDKLSALEAWHTKAEESMGTLLQRTTETTTRMEEMAARVKSLEFRPPPLPLPPPPIQ
jgi:DNA repair exonuclease SbcCD ATPase subunit